MASATINSPAISWQVRDTRTPLDNLPYRPPVYALLPAIYAATNHSLAAVRILQAGLDAVTVLFVYGIAKRVVGSRPAVLSGIGVAVYPLLIYETGLLIPETLSYTLQFGAAWCLILMLGRNHLALPWITGVLMGLTLLARPTTTLWIPLVLLWILLLPRFADRRLARLAASLVGLAMVFTPWTVRNLVALGSVIPVSSLGAVNIWSGNNALAEGGSVLPSAATWADPNYYERGWHGWEGLSEAESNRRFAAAGQKWIREHPGELIALIPKKLLRLWSPVSYSVQSGRETSKMMMTLVIPPYLASLHLPAVASFSQGVDGKRRSRYWPSSFPSMSWL